MVQEAGLVIVGAGQAGAQLALSLRAEGYEHSITLIGDEPHLPYLRPPLSKAYLLGKTPRNGLFIQSSDALQKKAISCLSGSVVAAINRSHKKVVFDNGTTLSYRTLVLATGSRHRTLPQVPHGLNGVYALRTLDDADRIHAALNKKRRCVVIGGGFIGLEFAAVARSMGHEVTLIEASANLMGRVVSRDTASVFAELHQAQGVRLLLDTKVTAISGAQHHVSEVTLQSGERLSTDFVLIGIGALANDSLAAESGLPTDNGVLVNQTLQTADPNIFAIGDCAVMISGGNRLRYESVQNAVDQAKHLAKCLVTRPGAYSAVPWFWSDQFDTRLQIAGSSAGAATKITRGKLGQRNFSTFFFNQNKLVGVESVNQPLEHVLARKLLAQPQSLCPEQVKDLNFNLKTFLSENRSQVT